MKEKLEAIFSFLKDHRKYNREIQSVFFGSVFNNKTSKKEKLISLLYHVAETQSQPSIKHLHKSYKQFYEKLEEEFDSFEVFCSSIGCDKKYFDLFTKIKSDDFPGYGDKTSALFVRMIYQIHNIDEYKKYKIWDDVPKLECEDKLFLPVDRVIEEIFNQKISHPDKKKWNFNNINKLLNEQFKGSDIEVWDDLWFWGFITQKVVKNETKREIEWNEAKYWVMKESNKNKRVKKEIQEKAKDFITKL